MKKITVEIEIHPDVINEDAIKDIVGIFDGLKEDTLLHGGLIVDCKELAFPLHDTEGRVIGQFKVEEIGDENAKYALNDDDN